MAQNGLQHFYSSIEKVNFTNRLCHISHSNNWWTIITVMFCLLIQQIKCSINTFEYRWFHLFWKRKKYWTFFFHIENFDIFHELGSLSQLKKEGSVYPASLTVFYCLFEFNLFVSFFIFHNFSERHCYICCLFCAIPSVQKWFLFLNFTCLNTLFSRDS